jgi:epoxyqueuosine reductase
MRLQADTDWIITKAKSLGFDLCGVAPAENWNELAHRDEWLARGYAGEMRYLHDARRADPALVLPEARSVIVCALNYNTRPPLSTEAVAAVPQSGTGARGWISRYAWGDDYHTVLGEKLEKLVAAMTERFGDQLSVRAYVDTGPVSERIAAHHAGLGWLAKNTCLINEEMGSWLFLGVVLTSLDLAPSIPRTDIGRLASSDPAPALPADLCGQCTLCLDACPTGALVEPYVLDARRCISYLTIELRGSIPEEFRAAMGWHVFGCDICQDVCPWNRKAPVTEQPAFAPRENLVAPELDWLLSLSEADFRQTFRGSAVRRTKWRGLVRNACVAAGNALRQSALARGERASNEVAPGERVSEMTRLRARLAELAASADAIIAGHARWALAQFGAAEGGTRSRQGDNVAHPP